MKLLCIVVCTLALAGCEDARRSAARDWAATVTPAQDRAPPSCDADHQVRVLTPGAKSGNEMTRAVDGLLDDYGALKADFDRCRTWARGQR